MTCDTISNDVTMAGGVEGAFLAGRYRVVRQLGQGGMGSVWLAEDTQLDNKPFAIKMLPSILVSNKRAYRQLKDEALVAMKLSHPNIVTLRAFEENNGNPFLVMDYIDGVTLDDYLAGKGSLSEDEVVRILKPIAAALDYAHGEGVVHRDVKPANVMIRNDGHPFILDFGIAREIQETMTRVTGKLSSGTLLYMSPEQLNGDPPRKEQDIYSFAVVVYECLKGEPPFSRGQIEFQILNNPPPPLELTGEVAILAAGVMSGLAKKPENRPPTCSAVLEGNVSRGGAETQRTSGAGKVLAVLSLLAAIGIGSWWLATGGTYPPRPKAEVALASSMRGGVSPVIFDAGHEGVQLWEGGPYWATTNIGAEKPEDCGLYFWWGDTTGHRPPGTKFDFDFSKDNPAIYTYGKSISELKSAGWLTGSGVLAPEHDAAHVNWGGKWRMPTKQELDDLNDRCDWEWTAINGENGYNVHGKGAYASKSIFLPAAGYGCGTSLSYSGLVGRYWSSVPGSDGYDSWRLYFDSGGHYTYYSHRNLGFSVRPVQGFAK